MFDSICVCGAGTMGSGIAQTIAQSGFKTLLFDVNEEVLAKAKSNIYKSLNGLVAKNKITEEQHTQITNNLIFIDNIEQVKADLIIEAIIEKLDAKISLFKKLAQINSLQTVFASNTSSLSITEVQNAIEHPERVIGLHFFNPATVMKLVEVVKGEYSDEQTIHDADAFCKEINKVPVICKDAPGFIVNRVARHYYLESLKSLENKIASKEAIDNILEASGFRLGPFKLMDLIGMDINLAVTEHLYETSNKAERFKPSQIQQQLVAEGKLGKKTGEGFYKYNEQSN
ncbi:MAG: hypothetical protein NVSMB45_04210 [Ginsengibacter sp.]